MGIRARTRSVVQRGPPLPHVSLLVSPEYLFKQPPCRSGNDDGFGDATAPKGRAYDSLVVTNLVRETSGVSRNCTAVFLARPFSNPQKCSPGARRCPGPGGVALPGPVAFAGPLEGLEGGSVFRRPQQRGGSSTDEFSAPWAAEVFVAGRHSRGGTEHARVPRGVWRRRPLLRGGGPGPSVRRTVWRGRRDRWRWPRS